MLGRGGLALRSLFRLPLLLAAAVVAVVACATYVGELYLSAKLSPLLAGQDPESQILHVGGCPRWKPADPARDYLGVLSPPPPMFDGSDGPWPPEMPSLGFEPGKEPLSKTSDNPRLALGVQIQANVLCTDGRRRAIVLLVKRSKLHELTRSLRLLFENFNWRYRYPVILFYDRRDVSPLEIMRYCIHYEGGLEWDYARRIKLVDVTIGESLGRAADMASVRARLGPQWEPLNADNFPGYNHMIMFWFKHVFELKIMEGVDYMWRLDTDSSILEPITYDVFELMHRRRYAYGYISLEDDQPFVTNGLFAAVSNFTAMRAASRRPLPENGLGGVGIGAAYPRGLVDKVPPSDVPLLPLPEDWAATPVPIFYNNFEIVHVPTFATNPDLLEFVNFIVATHGIYEHRWGDAPLRYFQVQLFLRKGQVHHFCDIAYYHNGPFPAKKYPRCDWTQIQANVKYQSHLHDKQAAVLPL